jgi:hypothetical protein
MSHISPFSAPSHKVLAYLAVLLKRDRSNVVEILRVLAAVDGRRLYAPFPSLYAYCLQVLQMSEYEAYMRILASRKVRRFPVILEMIEAGRLTLTSVRLLAPYLEQRTAGELLEAASGKSKRDLQLLLAERFPKPDLPTRIVPVFTTPLGQVSTGSSTSSCVRPLGPDPVGAVSPAESADTAMMYEEPSPPARVEPIAPHRFALQLTNSRATHEKLRHAQELLSHVLGTGDVADVIDRALDALIEKQEKAAVGSTANPRPRPARVHSDHVPLAEQARVIARDGWQCSFPMPDGGVCGSRWRLQLHHLVSKAKGGSNCASNLALRCACHHQQETEAEFGVPLVEGKIERRRGG